MSKLTAIISIAAMAGAGYYIGKRIFDKKKAEKELNPELYAEERHSSPKEKLQRASLFAVGAIRTGTEKIKEGIDEIIDKDMVSKGEATVSDVKNFAMDKKEKTVAFVNDKTAAIKDEIDNLKNMVSSINTEGGEEEEFIVPEDDYSDEEEKTEDTEETEESEESEEAAPEAAETVEKAAEEVKESSDEIDELFFDGSDNVSVDTFDFSSADKL